MKKVLTIGASNSKNSINRQFAVWAVGQIKGAELVGVDLNDFEMPIYSQDREQENGIPQLAKDFKSLVTQSDGIIISFAEHNGNYSVAFKNILDWMSRLGRPFWSDKPMLLLATSPGRRGGKGVLEIAERTLPHQGGVVAGSFSLPDFNQNFSAEQGIIDNVETDRFNSELNKFVASLESPVAV